MGRPFSRLNTVIVQLVDQKVRGPIEILLARGGIARRRDKLVNQLVVRFVPGKASPQVGGQAVAIGQLAGCVGGGWTSDEHIRPNARPVLDVLSCILRIVEQTIDQLGLALAAGSR